MRCKSRLSSPINRRPQLADIQAILRANLDTLCRGQGFADAELFGFRQTGLCAAFTGRLTEAERSFEALVQTGGSREPEDLARYGLRYGYDPYVSGLAAHGQTLTMLGYAERAKSSLEEALNLAKTLDHIHSRALVLTIVAMADRIANHADLQLQRARSMRVLAEDQGFEYIRAIALMLEASALSQNDPDESVRKLGEEGFAAWESTGTALGRPFWVGLMGELLLNCGDLDEAAAQLGAAEEDMEETDQRYYLPEIQRLTAEIAICRNDRASAESLLRNALVGAHEMQARLFELRAAICLTRLTGKSEIRQDCLAPIFSWFSEGFDTPELVEAKALLDELA